MSGEIEILYERNLRIAIAEAVKKDRVETLRLAREVSERYFYDVSTSAGRVMKILEERAS